MLRINEVVKYMDFKYRILDIEDDLYIWINIYSDRALPERILKTEIETQILSENLKKVQDPFGSLTEELPESGSKAQRIRDKRLKIIHPLIEDRSIYLRSGRGASVETVANSSKTAKKTVYAYLRQYWQRGCTPNALLPDYKHSGGTGKKRNSGKKKLGRPRSTTPGVGTRIDASVEQIFRIVLDRHYLTENAHSLAYAHRRFESIYEAANPHLPKEEFPTLTQLKHFYKREYTRPDRIRRKSNKIEYNKDIRPLHGTAAANVHGPGARYEIDATIADVYLLSSDRRNIIGRPILYIVIDVFSRLITGFYVGLENPSYATAILALESAMTDKTELCKSYGYTLNEEDWPSTGLPDAILADRGELLGHQIERLELGFGIRIENTPPYRGDAKGIVERTFLTLHANYKPFAPGAVSGTIVKKRAGKDYRLDATLTMADFRKIILGSILQRNNNAVLSKYDRDPDMPNTIPPIPIQIWRWGIQHRSGRLRNAPREALKLALLPREKVTVSPDGIRCFGAFYTCKELIETGWLHRTTQMRPTSLEAAYDPATADHIYLFPESNKSASWKCSLTEHSRQFRNKSMWELWDTLKQQRKVVAEAKVSERESKRHMEDLIQKTIKEAEKKRPRNLTDTKAEALSTIGKNRRKAKDQERKERNKLTDENQPKPMAKITHICEEDDNEGKFPDFIDDLFTDDQ